MESNPPTMSTIQGTQWNDYHPIASLDSYPAPIEFEIPPYTEFYTDLSNSESYSKWVKILNRVQKYFQLTAFLQYVQWHQFVYQHSIDHE